MKSRKSQSVSNLEAHTGFWLRFVSNDVSHRFARRLAGSGVTVAEWVILREMFDTDMASPSGLATAAGLTRGAISKLVDRLLRKDLVSRAEAVGDRRFQDIKLTPTGRALVPRLAAIADRNDEECFSKISAEERESLVSTLRKLAAANNLSKIPIK